ncbi:hypothetical protein FisN_11Hu008 [Fistulifera solaris]|uniref:Uncharacterized protein n=1 Tax=Fistulifera solaris TaxID=1519565 RepID=A0A1Z5JL73_FISSO|nr:hypothetical protein FisN_11Hu008 [Fistulifera solaris]|eukprot:GAX14528.1 hypothetical protein FisN_11Hu008 [Fistulifera solaris]
MSRVDLKRDSITVMNKSVFAIMNMQKFCGWSRNSGPSASSVIQKFCDCRSKNSGFGVCDHELAEILWLVQNFWTIGVFGHTEIL